MYLKVIDNDHGVHMRPMPGMVGLISSNSKVIDGLSPPLKIDVEMLKVCWLFFLHTGFFYNSMHPAMKVHVAVQRHACVGSKYS